MNNRYKEFLENHDKCDFQQSEEWANVKSNWKNEKIIIENQNGEIIASASILIRKIPIFGFIMYIPRGPVCDLHDEYALERITVEIKSLQSKYKAFIVRVEPYAYANDEQFRLLVLRLGYKIMDKAKSFDEEIQARHNYRLNIKGKTGEEVFSSFSSKTRYNIRLAVRKGVEVKKADFGELDIFYKMMIETCERNMIIPRTKNYFERIFLCMGKSVEMYISYYEGLPISAIMTVIYGKKMWYLYGASSNKYRNIMANYLLQWKMIERAINLGLEVYDLRGSSGNLDLSNGLYRFKKGFGTEIVELIGEVVLEKNHIKCQLYRISEKYFRKIRRRLYLFKKKIDPPKHSLEDLLL